MPPESRNYESTQGPIKVQVNIGNYGASMPDFTFTVYRAGQHFMEECYQQMAPVMAFDRMQQAIQDQRVIKTMGRLTERVQAGIADIASQANVKLPDAQRGQQHLARFSQPAQFAGHRRP